jgi:hypothetical protein
LGDQIIQVQAAVHRLTTQLAEEAHLDEDVHINEQGEVRLEWPRCGSK